MRRTLPIERLRGMPHHGAGLDSASVVAQRARYGDNTLVEEPPSSLAALALDTVRDPMIWFLLGTGALYAWLGDALESAVLFASIVPLVAMDALLHRRTQRSTRALGGRLAAFATVIREGEERVIASRELVPGDLVRVVAGELLPADGLIVGGSEMQVDESALTGEALPVRKRPVESIPIERNEWAPPEEHCAAAGTRLLTGDALLRVVLTGRETLYGEIVRSVSPGTRARTPLQRAVSRLVAILLAVALATCVLLAWARWRQGFGLIDSLLSAVTLAVAAIPEEFPVVLTFFLSVGVYRLARRKALVRRAVVVENIGRTTCICTDKTGTLTEGRLRLVALEPAGGVSSGELAAMASSASRAGLGDPVDDAILERAGEPTTRPRERFAFTEDRRRETVIVESSTGLRAIVKGAPETVLAACVLDADERTHWLERTRALARDGRKVIAVAGRDLDERRSYGAEPVTGFTMAGLLAFADPVRRGVAAAIASARRAGIRVVMITGDHPATAQAVARELGIGGPCPAVLEIDELGATSVTERDLVHADVIARAMPAQKLALVRALQGAGAIVAVTGDGVNDVPALEAADIGIAMGEHGTRSAREVASVVLLDDELGTIVRAIAEGQQLFRNLQLSFAYLVMVHVPLVATAALIPLAGEPILYLPIHVVWLELVIHPTALLVFQEPARDAGLRPLRGGGPARFFDAPAWALIAVIAAAVLAAVLGGYLRGLGPHGDVEHARAIAIVTLVTASATMTAGLSGLRSRVARAVAGLTWLSAIVLVEVPPLASVLHVRPLHADDWAIACSAGVLPALLSVALRRHLVASERREVGAWSGTDASTPRAQPSCGVPE